MSWWLDLYKTYDENIHQVGVISTKYNGQQYTLLPISHTTQTAHIEVQITRDGEFHSATLITDKEDANTLIPTTEDSSSRSGSKIAPYPLHDKLMYVAGDYSTFGGEVKGENPFGVYIQALSKWVESPFSHHKINSIYQYVRKGTLINDLVEARIIAVDENQQIIKKWDKRYENLYGIKPDIFSAVAGEQDSAFIRFNVYSVEPGDKKVWHDPEVHQAYIQYYNTMLGESDICYVTGEHSSKSIKHANKIRNSGDKAKLISANDKAGFTFRGRFETSDQVAVISYEVSQKAHNALKWLINKQSQIIEGRVFLVWSSKGEEVYSFLEDPFADINIFEEEDQSIENVDFTNQYYANEVYKAQYGFKSELDTKSNVNILLLDSATTGRMGVLYYRNIDKQLYTEKLREWYQGCIWLYRINRKNTFSAPSFRDIAIAAYGVRTNDTLVKGFVERMLPCILDGKVIPLDIIKNLFHRASNPLSMSLLEWEKTLSVACSLIKQRREGYSVSLDETNNNRSYLFGRLLAVAEVLEKRALEDDSRSTNALRYMNAFSRYPARTWKTIRESLQSYQMKLGNKANDLNKIIDQIMVQFEEGDFDNRPLTEEYLLGLSSQRFKIYTKKQGN